MNIKKNSLLFLCTALLLTFNACKKDEDQNQNPTPTPAECNDDAHIGFTSLATDACSRAIVNERGSFAQFGHRVAFPGTRTDDQVAVSIAVHITRGAYGIAELGSSLGSVQHHAGHRADAAAEGLALRRLGPVQPHDALIPVQP